MVLTTESALRKDKTSGLGDMQHRHFATIADILKRLHSLGDDKNRTWVCDYFASELAKTNPKFDRARFLRACNAEDRI